MITGVPTLDDATVNNLAATTELSTRCVVYADAQDLLLAREAQAAGAFFELKPRLLAALPGYVRGRLPPHNRRDPAVFDRRRVFRGGRRCVDMSIIA